MKKIDIGVIVTTLIIVTISCSLAFFAARVVGEPKDINLVAKNVAITFNDTSIIANGVVSPGWNTTKTFTITNNSKEEYKYNISIKDLINTFVTEGYLQYKITSTNGYNMTEYKDIPKSSVATDTILAYSVSIPVGVTQSYTIEFKYANDENIDQSDDMGKKLSGTLFITEGTEPTLLSQLLENKSTVLTRTDFSKVLTDNNTNTLYTSTEDSKIVYYFAGNATDNWVKFGKQKQVICTYNGQQVSIGIYSSSVERINMVNLIENESECTGTNICVTTEFGPVIGVTQSECSDTHGQWITATPTYGGIEYLDIYWRIIRTNSDRSVRLLYHGTNTTATDAYIGRSAFNTTYNNPMYVGYMYGTSGSLVNNRTNTNNSTIKGVIDTWYKDNLNTNYGKYISTTAVYCNDRSNPAGGYNTGNTSFYYGARTRLDTNKTPSYDCATTEDKFTADSSTGNGKLTYPIALMTADEVAFAGGVSGNNAETWYYYNSVNSSSTGNTFWWLLSPYYWSGSYADVFGVNGSSFYPGNLANDIVDDTRGVRPAVSLKSCVKTSGGDGSAGTPYTIEESTSGC